MSLQKVLAERSELKCELCSRETPLSMVTMGEEESAATSLLICGRCRKEVGQQTPEPSKHWYCLQESIWSEHAAIKVAAYRILSRFPGDPWAQDLLEQIYLSDDELKAAQKLVTADGGGDETQGVPDSNGTLLKEGDQVTLIKDLEVKGAKFTAKRGTTVKNIHLTDDPKFVEGRINGTQVVLVAQFLKKS